MARAYLIIDERGDFFLQPDKMLTNLDLIQELERNLKFNEDFSLTTHTDEEEYWVESFDHPLMIVKIKINNEQIFLTTKHQVTFEADPKKWSVDEWDQFNGLTTTGAPFVLSEVAQGKLFNSVESFDDDGFTLGDKYIPTPPYFIESAPVEDSKFWGQIYEAEQNPSWNLNEPAEAFKDMLPRLKLPKSRILVLGCGEGHDAAFFARAGHLVTAVDFSAEAIERGKNKYGDIANLSFEKMNVFDLPQDWNYSFDLVVEHTCFCAIPPAQREDLVKVYRRVLHEEGQLLAVFFTMEKRSGPPYGATEWEIRERTKNHFQYLFWGRLRNSIDRRMGQELFVLGKKR